MNEQTPIDPPAPPSPTSAQLEPHRGGTVLTLGILSILLGACFPASIPLGIVGMQMSKGDLKAMDAGSMSHDGRSLTQAGRICSIIGLVLGCLGIVWWLLYLVVALGLAALGG